MYAVIVNFEIKSGFEEKFNEAMIDQAENSLTKESDCHYFDVCRDPENLNKFFLYELYTDRKGFDVHLISEHFLSFDALVTPWIESKTVSLMNRLDINS